MHNRVPVLIFLSHLEPNGIQNQKIEKCDGIGENLDLVNHQIVNFLEIQLGLVFPHLGAQLFCTYHHFQNPTLSFLPYCYFPIFGAFVVDDQWTPFFDKE